MICTVVTIHPSLVIVKHGDRTYELPATAFPEPPKVGQEWTLTLHHEPNEEEQRDTLNALLPHAE